MGDPATWDAFSDTCTRRQTARKEAEEPAHLHHGLENRQPVA
jgi:hypothetical protein